MGYTHLENFYGGIKVIQIADIFNPELKSIGTVVNKKRGYVC